MKTTQIIVSLSDVKIRIPLPLQRSKPNGTIKGLRGYNRQRNKRICRNEIQENRCW